MRKITPRTAGLSDVVRALRLPFISASVLAFVFGSLIERRYFNAAGFFLGLAAAVGVHLGANLINDYADSRSGADWQDTKFYNFFGGSKLIQEGRFSERWYLWGGVVSFALSFLCVIALARLLQDISAVFFYCIIVLAGIVYSCGPLRLAYRRLGEAAIFVLFGPALVMGGYFIQTGIFPDTRSLLLSLPFGFLTVNILFANEVPDYPQDRQAAKHTLVSLTGTEKAYLLYGFFFFCALASVGMAVARGYISPWAWAVALLAIPGLKAAAVLKNHSRDKMKLMQSSQITIAIHNGAGVLLALALFL